MNQFWRASAMEYMSPGEVALYAFLVNECNQHRWNMPVPCSTVRICEMLHMSKQTLCTARKNLDRRGLISFSEGKSRHVPSKYSLLIWTDNLTVKLTNGLTADFTPLKDKEKDNLNKKDSISILSNGKENHNRRRGIKRSLLLRRPMKARFKLPMSEDEAYAYLLAAMMAEVEYRHRSFCTSEDMENQLHEIAHWLTSSSPKFGMLLCGGCGNGKSTMLKAFQLLLNNLHIPKSFNDGTYGIQIVDAKYIAYLCKNNYDAYRKLISVDMLGIDDLGTEPSEVMDYGNVYTPVIDLLTKRYEEQLFIIITTNLTPQQIREHYDDRSADRLNEMVEKIVFKNGTYRNN